MVRSELIAKVFVLILVCWAKAMEANKINSNGCPQIWNISSKDCIQYKFVKSLKKLSSFQLGPLQLVKLSSNLWSSHDDIVEYDEHGEKPRSIHRSMSLSSLLSVFATGVRNVLSKYGLKVSLPQPTDDFPGILVEDRFNNRKLITQGRKVKKDAKKFALIFPIIATFKFMVIKALLIPILLTVFGIKNLMILGLMALPALIAMLRVCRGGGLFPGYTAGLYQGNSGLVGTTGPMAPYLAATDTILGDFSSYSHMTQSPYYSRHDYGGRNYVPLE